MVVQCNSGLLFNVLKEKLMKKFILVSLLSAVALISNAQTKCSVSVFGKKALNNAEENVAKNIIKIEKKLLKKSGNFIISFNNYDTAYKRTVMINDAEGQGIINFEDVNKPITISSKQLKTILNGKNKILFYYTKIPSDPSKAAIVRMRPIHICTVLVI
jgi:hypothetical protein